MSKQLFANNATSTLSGILPQGGTTLVCGAGHGSRFPTPTGGDYFLLTIYTKDAYSNEQQVEVVKVTARSGDIMTIERDVELLTGEIGGLAYNGSTTTVFLELRWTSLGASNMLQAADNLASLTSASTARTNLGLGSVNNTADIDKPISTATQTALNGKQPTLASTDGLSEGATNLYLTYARVRDTVLTGLSVATNAVVAAGDSVLVGLGKLQAQLTAHFGSGGAAHANATTGVAGFMSGTDKTKLDGAATLVGVETLTNKTFTGYKETVYAVTGTTPALNPDNGTIQTWTLSGNSSPTNSLEAGESMTLMVDDGTAYTITWPTITWVNGTAPTLKTSGYTVIVLWRVGATLYGRY